LGEPKIKRIILDVLKPRTSSLPLFATFLAELESVEKVEVTLVEINTKTDSLKVVLYGSGIDYSALKEHVGRDGAVIHSVDQVNVQTI
jgi:hypothetical protein